MKALQFRVNIPLWLTVKTLGAVLGKRMYYRGPLPTVRLADIPRPAAPRPEWVIVRTRYCGFCGSDLNLMLLHDSPSASPFTSFPCIMGHEITGIIEKKGQDVKTFHEGQRVVIMPFLACSARNIHPQCSSCRAGKPGNCENFAGGDLPPGMFTGINSGVPGGFTPRMTAHKSQLFPVPDKLSDEDAVMTEPLAVALQAVFDNMPQKGERVLVIGGGVIGNLIVQSIRAIGPACKIAVIEPAPHASRLAAEAGADLVIKPDSIPGKLTEFTGATYYKPLMGPDIAMGGFNRVFDTVANTVTMNTSLRMLAAMGTYSMVGIGGDVKLDLTPLWLKLQTVTGVYGYGMVPYKGKRRHVFDIALELMEQKKIHAGTLVTHRFRLEEYRQMIEVNLDKKAHGAMKTVVSFN